MRKSNAPSVKGTSLGAIPAAQRQTVLAESSDGAALQPSHALKRQKVQIVPKTGAAAQLPGRVVAHKGQETELDQQYFAVLYAKQGNKVRRALFCRILGFRQRIARQKCKSSFHTLHSGTISTNIPAHLCVGVCSNARTRLSWMACWQSPLKIAASYTTL